MAPASTRCPLHCSSHWPLRGACCLRTCAKAPRADAEPGRALSALPGAGAAGSWQHLHLPAFVAEQLSLKLLQPTLGFVWGRNEGIRGVIAGRVVRCCREDAQPEGTKPGARWRGARHSWEVLRQQGPNVQGTNLVPTEMPVVAQGQELFEVLPGGTHCAPRQGRTAPLGPRASPSARRERQPEAGAGNLRLLRFQLVERKTRPFISV